VGAEAKPHDKLQAPKVKSGVIPYLIDLLDELDLGFPPSMMSSRGIAGTQAVCDAIRN